MKKKLIIALVIILVLLTIVLVYNKSYKSHHIIVKEYSVVDKIIPEKYHGLKIVQYSDILYGKSANLTDIKNMVKKINETNPDIVVFTGDFFSKDVKISAKELDKIKIELSKITAKYDKFAVIGDNDLTFKDAFYQLFNDDYKILDNEHYLFYLNSDVPIRFTGINDVTKEEQLSEEDNKLFNILLIHKPDDLTSLKNNYNLAFAGHSIGGQIKLPFFGPLIKLKGAKTYVSGKYQVGNTTLFVNDGIGSQNFNMRIGNNPKINFYRLYAK